MTIREYGAIAANAIQSRLRKQRFGPAFDLAEECQMIADIIREGIPDELAEAQQRIAELEAELEKWKNPCPGDLEQQASAWVAVWKELEVAGIYKFIPPMMDMRSRTRAVEFIRFLAERARDPQ